jgi:hypothetical protein
MELHANYFLETNRLPFLRLVPGDRLDALSTLGLASSTGGRSGKRYAAKVV